MNNALETRMQRYREDFEMTDDEIERMFFEEGRQDGKGAIGLNNPPHRQWPEGPHFNPHYEAGYWNGYLSGEGKWRQVNA